MPEKTTLPLGERVVQAHNDGVSLWALPLGVPEVVSFRASLVTGLDLTSDDRMRQRLVARLLDRGSERRDRFEIADWLEGRGAVLHFFSDGPRLGLSGRALRADVPEVLALAAELLDAPRFDPAEVEKVKRELEAALRQASTDTAYLGDAALSRALYAPDHPAYIRPLDVQMDALASITRDDLADFHAACVRHRSLLMAVAGDLGGVPAGEVVAPFAAHARTGVLPPASPARREASGRTDISVADKSNYDVRMGQGIALRRRDSAFQALRVGVYALGGNFSARLMQEVRDRRGLTYGIRAGLENVAATYEGHFEVRATFSPADLQKGTDATLQVVNEWAGVGVTEEETERVKETLVGTYDVSLSTTRGLASAMLTRAEQGYTPRILDAYREEVQSVTPEAVNAAIRAHIEPSRLHTAVSGPPYTIVENDAG